jgi:ferredoxin-NADP reductase
VTDPLPLRLLDRRPLVPGVLHLRFGHAHGGPLPFRPGQFIQVLVPGADGQVQRRSYSLANAPSPEGEPGCWELVVSLMPGGVASRMFQTLAPEDTIHALGPFGRFGLQANDAARRYLLVATGTGVAPYRSMMRELEQRMVQSGVRVVLVVGARRREELPWHEEFISLAARQPHLDYIGCLSREAVGEADPHLRHGHVQAALHALNPGNGDIALLCGNPAMVDQSFQLLRDAGLPPALIRRERYVASG